MTSLAWKVENKNKYKIEIDFPKNIQITLKGMDNPVHTLLAFFASNQVWQQCFTLLITGKIGFSDPPKETASRFSHSS